MFQFLKKPYYLDLSLRKVTLTAAIIGIFIGLFLFIFKPFGLSEVQNNFLFIAAGYGAVTTVVMIVAHLLLSLIVGKEYDTSNWTVEHEIIWSLTLLILIGLGNAIYTKFIGIAALSWNNILYFQLYTIAVGILPITFLVLLKENQSSRKFEKEAGKISEKMNKKEKKQSPGMSITIPSHSKETNLQLNAKNLLYLKSANNYVEVFCLQDGRIEKKLVRNTLKQIDKELKGHAMFFRCHKSYIVNLTEVGHLSGNAQGYKLVFENFDERIPVSRKYNDTIEKLLEVQP